MIESLNRNNRKFVLQLVLALWCMVWAGVGSTRAQTAQSPLPQPTGHVNDYANVIDAATKQRLETILENLKRVAQIESAVVTVDTTGGQDIYNYSLAVARGWGIGPKDGDRAGLLLLVAVKDRKYFTQVSRHLEGDLPDGVLGQIQREKLVPRFKEEKYGQGISDTIETYVATLAQSRGFSIEGIDQRQAYRETDRSQGRSRGRGGTSLSFPKGCVFLLILLFVIFIFSRSGGGGGGSGCLNMFLLGSLLNSGGRSSGWGGGGFGGGGGGGGGGGFGGFGGGGDFGGGGAGGSW